MLYFTNVSIPCISELVVHLNLDKKFDDLEGHHTLRINCNRASWGHTQKMFRFNPIHLFADRADDKRILAGSLANSASGMFKSFTSTSVQYFVKKIDQAAMYKDFANAAMFSITKIGIDLGVAALR